MSYSAFGISSSDVVRPVNNINFCSHVHIIRLLDNVLMPVGKVIEFSGEITPPPLPPPTPPHTHTHIHTYTHVT